MKRLTELWCAIFHRRGWYWQAILPGQPNQRCPTCGRIWIEGRVISDVEWLQRAWMINARD